MPLSREDRARLLARMADLGPAGDPERFVAEAIALGPSALDELGELPGMDQLRAGLLRALPHLLPDGFAEYLSRVDQALAVYPEMARSEDPVLTLTRHPAWVGLATLELGDLLGEDRVERAIALASAGFEGTGGTAPGEVLWAMAEAAEEAGWTDRASSLLSAALDRPFDDETGRGEVRLLLALRYAEDDDPRALEVLESVVHATGPTRRRVHAAWVLAALTREAQPQKAIRILSEALGLLRSDPESDPGIADRVQKALADLGVPTAEA